MGTDIHMGAEAFDRKAGRWVNAGQVFETDRDWDYRPATRESLMALRDQPQRLLRMFSFRVLDDKYGDMRPCLSVQTVEAFKKYQAHLATQQHNLQVYRNKIGEEGWDYYGKVKPFEDDQWREMWVWIEEEHLLSEEQCMEVIEVALKVAEHDRYSDGEPATYRWDRWPDDPPFRIANLYTDRNYDVFAVLGNVRNGVAFAGCDTGDPIPYISDCRGIPDDADPATLELLSDQHSGTWCTLRELDEYDWDRLQFHRGVVDAKHYEAMRKLGAEDPFDDRVIAELGAGIGVSGWVSGGGVVVFDVPGYEHWKQRGESGTVRQSSKLSIFERDTPLGEDDVARQLAGAQVVAEAEERVISAHVQIQWTSTVRESMPDSFWRMIKALHNLVPEGGTTDDVRIVFDFDS
jgi:hypothetical protein